MCCARIQQKWRAENGEFQHAWQSVGRSKSKGEWYGNMWGCRRGHQCISIAPLITRKSKKRDVVFGSIWSSAAFALAQRCGEVLSGQHVLLQQHVEFQVLACMQVRIFSRPMYSLRTPICLTWDGRKYLPSACRLQQCFYWQHWKHFEVDAAQDQQTLPHVSMWSRILKLCYLLRLTTTWLLDGRITHASMLTLPSAVSYMYEIWGVRTFAAGLIGRILVIQEFRVLGQFRQADWPDSWSY